MLQRKIHGVPIKEYFADLVSSEVEVEPNNPAFRCFNDKFHVYFAAKIIFMLSISFWMIIFGVLFPWSILILWIPIMYFLTTIYALRQKRATCLWPAIMHSALAIIIWSSGTIFLFTTALFSTQTFLEMFGQGHHQQFSVRFLVVLMIKAAIVFFGVYLIYQLYIFNQCRKYFDHVRNADLPQASREEATELKVIQDKSCLPEK